MINRIAYLRDGQIERLVNAQGINPDEGPQPDGTTVVHIDFPISSGAAFMRSHYYDNGWVERPEPPNPHCSWLAGEWTWDHDILLNDVRTARNKRLRACDWTQMPDTGLTEQQRSDWREYRQTLRDITDHCEAITCLADVVWPTKP